MKNILVIPFICMIFVFSTNLNFAKNENKTHKLSLNNSIKTLELEGEVNFSNPNIDQSGKIFIMIAGEDSLSASIYGPLGITVAKVFIDSSKFIVYNALKDEAYEGNPQNVLSKFTKTQIDYKSLFRLLRCDFLHNPDDYKYFDNNKNPFYAYVKDSLRNELMKVNDKNKISDLQIKKKAGELEAEVFFKNYTDDTQFQIAELLQIKVPKLTTNVEINYNKIRINEKFTKPFTFSLSKYTKVIKISK